MTLNLNVLHPMVVMITREVTLSLVSKTKRTIAARNDIVAHTKYAYGRVYTIASGCIPNFGCNLFVKYCS